MTVDIRITPRDPLIARDGRKFGAGSRMKSLGWLRPSVVAGSLRTLLGKLNGGKFDKDTVEKLKALRMAGPFPFGNGTVYFPAPRDVLVEQNGAERIIHVLRPGEIRDGEGMDEDMELIQPLFMTPQAAFKPASVPAFWSAERMADWLIDPDVDSFEIPDPEDGKMPEDCGFLKLPSQADRVHVKIDPATGTAEDKNLFSTTGLDMNLPGGSVMEMALRVDGDADPFVDLATGLDELHPCGGERRLVRWRGQPECEKLWKCPVAVMNSLKGAKRIRMVLASPAVFRKGWLPGWLEKSKDGYEGIIPGTEVRVRLVSAVTGRWEPLSGWSYETRSPKPISRMVPAGSVYFFEVLAGNSAQLAERWLRPVNDEEQPGRDGFGLALWGTWNTSIEG